MVVVIVVEDNIVYVVLCVFEVVVDLMEKVRRDLVENSTFSQASFWNLLLSILPKSGM